MRFKRAVFDLSARFCMMVSLYFPFNYPIFVSQEHMFPFFMSSRPPLFPLYLPGSHPTSESCRRSHQGSDSSSIIIKNHWDQQSGADERSRRINRVIKPQRCDIKQKAPPSLPRLDGKGWGGVEDVAPRAALLLISTASLNTLLLS